MTPRWLWVLRHAKAGAHGPDDRGRSITGRGRRQAADVASTLGAAPSAGLVLPTVVLCSSADRARQTAEVVLGALGPDAVLVVDRALYQADAYDIIDVLREVGDDAAAVMVVGHNPALYELVAVLLDPDDADGAARLQAGFPTAALAVVGLDLASWAQLTVGTGTLLDLMLPEAHTKGHG